MEQLRILMNRLKNSPNKIRIAVVMGIAGIIMIMLSEVLPEKGKAVTDEEN